ncbi:MAG: sensor histidine kinase [Patescibacteria group bacterium]
MKIHRIQDKLLIYFIALAFCPMLFLGVVSLYLIDQSHSRDVSNLEVQMLNQKLSEIQKFFADSFKALELRSGVNSDLVLEELLAANAAFEDVRIIDSQTNQIINRAVRSEEISISIEENNFVKLPYVQSVKDKGRYIGPVRHLASGPRVLIAAPIRGENGTITNNIILADINLDSIQSPDNLVRSVEAVHIGRRGYMVLVDNLGRLLARGDVSNADQFVAGSSLVESSRVRQVLVGEKFNGFQKTDRYNSFLNGEVVIGAGAAVEGLGWGLFVEWPRDDADIVIQAIRNQMLGVLVGSIIIVLLLAPLFSGRIVKPIHDLEVHAAEIEKGNFETKIVIKTGDELEELGSAFNRMTEGLKRLKELQKEFVFIAAHELRTPVTATKWSLSLVLDGTLGAVPEALRDTLEKIKQANDRLVQLVNDILEIARNDAGRLKVEVSAQDIAPAIRAIMTEAEPLAKEKSITLSYEALPNAPAVLMDPSRVKEVAMNFISNAIKYNHAGGWIKIYHERVGDTLLTHVEDSGFGMSSEDQQHMFEKFFRSETKEIKNIIGTGLGLFITRELVEKMNGKVSFRSELGKGSRFSFSLPLSVSRG